MVQCHVCDVGDDSRTASLATYILNIQKSYPGRNPRNKPVGWSVHQPTLVRGQTNRIIVFRGSFNPPHVGHLNLLTYAFYHGGQDIRAAIIMTASDESLATKFTNADETMRLSKKDRQKLWKNDVRLPNWVWVYEDSSDELKKLTRRLKENAYTAGYELEYLRLYGPDGLDLFGGDSTVSMDDRFRSRDSNQVLICDVSREAGLQSAELKTLSGFEPWKKLKLDEQALEGEAGAEAENMLAILRAKAPGEYDRAVERGDHTIKQPVTATMNDSESIWTCHQIRNPNIHWRFVRTNRLAHPEYRKETISSTMLRATMDAGKEDHEKADVQTMALSPNLLLSMRSKWERRFRALEERRKENQEALSFNVVEK